MLKVKNSVLFIMARPYHHFALNGDVEREQVVDKNQVHHLEVVLIIVLTVFLSIGVIKTIFCIGKLCCELCKTKKEIVVNAV